LLLVILFAVINVGRRYEYFETNEIEGLQDCKITKLHKYKINGKIQGPGKSFEQKKCPRIDEYRQNLQSTSFSVRKLMGRQCANPESTSL